MRTVILDYEAGNLTSVLRACRALGHDALVTADPAAVDGAEKVIFPGVGAAEACMGSLVRSGLAAALGRAVASGRPVFGICIGMQLLFERSEEDGDVPCLGILPGSVRRFRPSDPAIKVPHMGWNRIAFTADPIFAGVDPESAVYFVHSYHCVPGPGLPALATSDHGGSFCAAVRRDNLVAVQFHPEKSGPVGLRILGNFLRG